MNLLVLLASLIAFVLVFAIVAVTLVVIVSRIMKPKRTS